MYSYIIAGFEDELEKIASSGSNIMKATETINTGLKSLKEGSNLSNLAGSSRVKRFQNNSGRMYDILKKRQGRARAMAQGVVSPFSTPGKATLDKARHLSGTASTLSSARQSIQANADNLGYR